MNTTQLNEKQLDNIAAAGKAENFYLPSKEVIKGLLGEKHGAYKKY